MLKVYFYCINLFRWRFLAILLAAFSLGTWVFADNECSDSGATVDKLVNIIELDLIPYASSYVDKGNIEEGKIPAYLSEIVGYYDKLRVCKWPYSERFSNMPKYNDILFETQLKTITGSLEKLQGLSKGSNEFEIEIRNTLYMSRELVKMFSQEEQ